MDHAQKKHQWQQVKQTYQVGKIYGVSVGRVRCDDCPGTMATTFWPSRSVVRDMVAVVVVELPCLAESSALSISALGMGGHCPGFNGLDDALHFQPAPISGANGVE